MASGSRYHSGNIEIDTEGPSAKSSQVTQRLERIGRNYVKLEQILDELEQKMAMDDRLGPAADSGDSRRSVASRPRQPR